MLRYIKQSAVNESTDLQQTVMEDSTANHLPLQEIDVGAKTKDQLKKKSEKRKHVLMDMKSLCLTTAKVFANKLPLSNALLKSLSCLHPKNQRVPLNDIVTVAKAIPCVNRSTETMNQLSDEWRIHSLSGEPEKEFRVDYYWAQILKTTDAKGKSKFPSLGKVVKAALCLSHGNADAERSLSANKRTVTAERVSLNEKTLVGPWVTKEAVKLNGGPTKVPITRTLLNCARCTSTKE